MLGETNAHLTSMPHIRTWRTTSSVYSIYPENTLTRMRFDHVEQHGCTNETVANEGNQSTYLYQSDQYMVDANDTYSYIRVKKNGLYLIQGEACFYPWNLVNRSAYICLYLNNGSYAQETSDALTYGCGIGRMTLQATTVLYLMAGTDIYFKMTSDNTCEDIQTYGYTFAEVTKLE